MAMLLNGSPLPVKKKRPAYKREGLKTSTIRIPVELYAQLEDTAKAQHDTINSMIVRCLRAQLAQIEGARVESTAFGKISRKERSQLETCLDLLRNSPMKSRRVLNAVLTWWRLERKQK